jgi:hypothetical protein
MLLNILKCPSPNILFVLLFLFLLGFFFFFKKKEVVVNVPRR